ncbi:hypothetical protein [Nocardia seriolae]|uniref:Uncharacterized protein n=1 Tax=Nocardia seriolae TaxID=37332 RepID=A0ABC9YST5_9NOCA|nr:hypothetical protein [Nocardia seriolae]APA98135.1 hypothetical protein NS506_04087 [Nocardia seriolae]MTJ62820.1 hypothetical protein [Nocardia seriolae]MTJ73496.1 hypothetical protein [Nocardia seriolae]MTJ87854.1 hypothetical protein [Nocardia seriolae]MTK31847.1 hypothetical protein [Nocardia seriolae]
MVAEFGWQRIPPADLRVLELLIRMKQQRQTPSPLKFEGFIGAWFAVRTTDQAAVLDALDLHDPVSATLRMGFSPWQGTEPMRIPGLVDWTDEAQSEFRDIYPQVFVTPALTAGLWCSTDTASRA